MQTDGNQVPNFPYGALFFRLNGNLFARLPLEQWLQVTPGGQLAQLQSPPSAFWDDHADCAMISEEAFRFALHAAAAGNQHG